ncbi:AAEL006520-PA [Aedes aegypti]|uniref:AAEL006520-PA n=1 Tax=Aedes aegypti TaxID=7159 RepID=Q0IF55_AEDAE|nr:AAEL006520-PA [Aedes aegypti]
MNVYIKSVVYLVAFGGAGYVLSELTKPSKEKIDLLKRQHHGGPAASEAASKKALFMQKLKEASESSEPIYLKKKAD